MTAEELLRLCDRIISSGGFDTLTSVDRCTIARALRDRLTDAQAQRIAELEAQLAARGPDTEVLAKRIKAKLRELLANPVTIDEGAASLADLVLSSGALATAHAEKLQENSCPPRRCDSAGIGGEMGSLSPVATAQAVTLTEESLKTAFKQIAAENGGWPLSLDTLTEKLSARLTNGASTP